jgi:hypothetical protein
MTQPAYGYPRAPALGQILIQRARPTFIPTSSQYYLGVDDIPQNFTHLYMEVELKGTSTGSFTSVTSFIFNDDFGANYAVTRINQGGGGGATLISGIPTVGNSSNSVTGTELHAWGATFDIFAYTSSWDKQVLGHAFNYAGNAGQHHEIYVTGVRWGSSQPIRKISWTNGSTWRLPSCMTLWGIP